ncbi:TPA: hypothetical protein U5489_001301 [Legionella pneumophila]|nr:hypothetical protein [Legionella pneumophila]
MSVNKLRSILKRALPNLSKMFSEKEGVQQYRKILTYFLKDGVIDPLELEQLKYVENKYELTKEEIRKIQRKALSTYFNEIISDQRISEEERKSLQDLLNLFSLQTNEINFDQKIFNKYYTLGLIEQGSLPSVENKNELNIIFKPNEILHYGASSQLNKIKKVTKRINYGGLTGSIKIMKGVRYRIGSIGVQKKHKKFLIQKMSEFYTLQTNVLVSKVIRSNLISYLIKSYLLNYFQKASLYSNKAKKLLIF